MAAKWQNANTYDDFTYNDVTYKQTQLCFLSDIQLEVFLFTFIS